MIQGIYDQMWQTFQFASKHNAFELDPFLRSPEKDTRRGISTLAYLNQGEDTTLAKIIAFQNAIKEIEPNQYYHPKNELHLTVLPVISCLENFKLQDIDPINYIAIFQEVLSQAKPITIRYQGVSASSNCIVIQGFPLDENLENLRNTFRREWQKTKLKINIDTRYKLITAHSSAIRFCVPINNGARLYDLCHQFRNYDFGEIKLMNFDLVFNNWYQNLSVTKTLSNYNLSTKK